MSVPFSQEKLKGEERRAILQAIETQMQQVIIDGVTQVLQEFLEQEVTIKLGRPKRSPRRMRRSVALAVSQGLRWRSISRSSGSMLSGPRRPGGRSRSPFISTSSVPTLSKGYATDIRQIKAASALCHKDVLKVSRKSRDGVNSFPRILPSFHTRF